MARLGRAVREEASEIGGRLPIEPPGPDRKNAPNEAPFYEGGIVGPVALPPNHSTAEEKDGNDGG